MTLPHGLRCALLLALAMGCATMPERLEKRFQGADYRHVVTEGRAYLDQKPHAPDAEDVRRLVAQAGYALARDENTIAGYRAFRVTIEGWREAIYERKESLIQEAEVAFSVAAKAHTTSAYVEFRRAYPKSARVADAHRMEVDAAFKGAERGDTVSGWQGFLSTYGARDDAADYLERARRAEAAAAFKALQKGATGTAVAAFKVRYQGLYDEVAVAKFERTVLFREARQIDTLEAYAALRKRYGEDPYAAPGLMAIRHRELRLARSAVRSVPTVGRCQALFDEYARWSELAQILPPLRAPCAQRELMALTQAPEADPIEAFLRRYGHYDDVVPALSDAADLLYTLRPTGDRDQGDAWRGDSRLLDALQLPLRAFLPVSGESRREAKTRQLAFERTQRDLQRRYRGREVMLNAVRIVDIRPELTLTKKGRKRAVRVVRKLKGHPGLGVLLNLDEGAELDRLAAYYVGPLLGKCRRCLTGTGRYVVRAELPVPISISGYGHLAEGEGPGAIAAEVSGYVSVTGAAMDPNQLRWWRLPGSTFPVLGPMDAFVNGRPASSTSIAGVVALTPVAVEFVVENEGEAKALETGTVMPLGGRIDGFRVEGRALELRLQ